MDAARNDLEHGRSTTKEPQEFRQRKSHVPGQLSIQDKLLFSSLGVGRARAEADNNHNIQRVLLDKEYLEFERKCLNDNVNTDEGGYRKGKGCSKLKENASRSGGIASSNLDVGGSRKGIRSLKLNESASESPGGVNSNVGVKLNGKSSLKLKETPSRSAGVIPMGPELLKRKREHVLDDIRSSKAAALTRHVGEDSKGKAVMGARRADDRDVVWEKRISDPISAMKNVLQLPQHVIKTGCLMGSSGIHRTDLYDADKNEHHVCEVHTVHRDNRIEQFLAMGWYEFAKKKGLTKGDIIRFCFKDRPATRISVSVFKEVIYVG